MNTNYSGKTKKYKTYLPLCVRMDSQIAFFCGNSELCLSLGSDEALATAKHNIEAHYVTVGVLELLEAWVNIFKQIEQRLAGPAKAANRKKTFYFLFF